jgi:hypothetical protein
MFHIVVELALVPSFAGTGGGSCSLLALRIVDWTPCGATFQRSGIPSEATLVFPDAYA